MGDDDLALQDYLKAVDLQPDSAAALGSLGQLMHDRNRYAEAIEIFSRAIAVLPDESSLHARRAISSFSLGKYREAFDDMDKATSKIH